MASGPNASAMWSADQEVGPQGLHVPDAALAVPQDAEAHVGSPSRERERPRVPGEQVRLEPHPQVLGAGAGDAVEVLAEGVPLTEVAAGAEVEGLADGRPHAVGRDHVASRDGAEGVDLDGRPIARHRSHRREAVAVVDLHAGGPGQVDQCGVELEPRDDGGELTLPSGSGKRDRSPRRGAHPGRVDLPPSGQGGGLEAERAPGAAARPSSARRRSTCRGGSGPCRPGRRRGRPWPARPRPRPRLARRPRRRHRSRSHRS